ncbi:MAG: hypothetical protein RQ757_11110 [Pseudomonadales bacterium]|nr:hypothetical protein [Pseudomonadales bacterium]
MLIILTCSVSFSASAMDAGEFSFNQFGTAGLSHLGGESDGQSFGIRGQTNDKWRGDQLSRYGAQLKYGITEEISVTGLLLTKPESDEWEVEAELLYLSWQASDRLMLRGGRLRAPLYKYSETLDVGITYPWLRLPDEVYGQIQMSNFEGADLVYTVPLEFGSFNVQLAGGQAVDRNLFMADDLFDIDYKEYRSAVLSLDTNSYGSLRASYNRAEMKLNTPLAVLDGNKGQFGSISYQYDNGTWFTSTEAVRFTAEGNVMSDSDAFYVMGGRRFGKFAAHLTFAQLDAENAGIQASTTYALNYNIRPNIILKSEYKRVDTRGGFAGIFALKADELMANGMFAMSGGTMGSAPRNFDGDIVSIGIEFAM